MRESFSRDTEISSLRGEGGGGKKDTEKEGERETHTEPLCFLPEASLAVHGEISTKTQTESRTPSPRPVYNYFNVVTTIPYIDAY